MEIRKKRLTPEQALQKLRHYCAYQERSHEEVRTKAFGFGLRPADVDPLVASLIEENYLNEERFAIAFAGGKFRTRKWGRVRIAYELKQRRVGDYTIRKALQAIPEEDYVRAAAQVAAKKWKSIRGVGVTDLLRQAKTRAYLQTRGFEANVISLVIRQLLEQVKEE